MNNHRILDKTLYLAARAGLVCLIGLALSGCDALAPQEPVTITFAVSEDRASYYEGLIESFNEKYSHITVEIRSYDPRDQPDENTLTADAGVVETYALSELVEAGEVRNLDPLIAEDRSFDLADFYPVTVDALTYEGQVWAIPAGADPYVTFYHEIKLDGAEAAYPESGWTWDDLLTMSQTVRDLQSGTFGYGYTYWDPVLFIYQHGGQIVDDPVNPTRVTFDDPLTVEALQWYADLIHVYDVVPSPDEISKWGRWGIGGAWYGNQLGSISWPLSFRGGRGGYPWANAGVRYGMVTPARDARTVTWVDVEGYVISARSEHPEAAWQWIVYLSEQIPERLTPARQALAESAEYEEKVGEDVATIAREAMAQAFTLGPKFWVEFGDTWSVFREAINDIESGESTPQEALSQAQQEAESQAP